MLTRKVDLTGLTIIDIGERARLPLSGEFDDRSLADLLVQEWIPYFECHKCGRCVQQCGWGVYSFNERPFPDDSKCRACHRCVTYCPAHCIKIKKNDLALRDNANWSPELRKNVWRQAESGGVMLTGMGNDKPYLKIFDHLVLDACQVTNPSIDPLREPMELRTYLGRKPDSVGVESDGKGVYKLKEGGDRHASVVDPTNGMLYEFFDPALNLVGEITIAELVADWEANAA